jgi:hypothetical protein
VSRNREDGSEIPEVPVPMRMKSLGIWIGEKMKKARTRILMTFRNPKEYSPPFLLSLPAISPVP